MLMCESCFPDGIEIGTITEGFSLIYHDKQFKIVEAPGHRGNSIYTFPERPWPDPNPDEEDNVDDELQENWLRLLRQVEKTLILPPQTGYALVHGVVSEATCGGSFQYWLLDKCGKMVVEYQRSHYFHCDCEPSGKIANNNKITEGPPDDEDLS